VGACIRWFGMIGFRCRARSAAGVTWTSRTASPFRATASPTARTASAGWAGRYLHSTVIDAAGAIYVIGGSGSSGYYQDVWVSTDGGARAGLSRGGGQGVDWVGTIGVLQGVLQGVQGAY
jgi:hypothetical protein